MKIIMKKGLIKVLFFISLFSLFSLSPTGCAEFTSMNSLTQSLLTCFDEDYKTIGVTKRDLGFTKL